ncbi:MAG: 50S ribosome-binding GTPase [Pirellulales bacterium]|nr:50S ribosome-binding GTPase [Pirellulales bacterium]
MRTACTWQPMQKSGNDVRDWAAWLRRAQQALTALAEPIGALAVPSPAGHEWHELLVHKLLPQTRGEPWLVVAVVGGTNIGKSLLFNHLAGETASGVSPLAAGTKHPVCLVPPDFHSRAELAELFPGFELAPWHSADDALGAGETDHLFWREGVRVPARLLLLDTPDIDSDAQVNWRRADSVRQAADVLIAVLTQQKYNDAAVKQFFRKAAAADKAVIVVFNQVDVQEDREYWPLWLETFTAETGVAPELVYVVPYDRRAANSLALSFYEVGPTGRNAPEQSSSLRDELAALKFDAIKLRTLRGALATVTTGLPAYLAQIRAAASEFGVAQNVLASTDMARVEWPTLPSRLMVEEIQTWWDQRRAAWSRRVHGAYRQAWQAITWPVTAGWRALNPAGPDPLAQFHQAEHDAIVCAVGDLLGQLERLAEVGNETLRPRLQKLLSGDSRRSLLARIETAHAQLPPVADDYRAHLHEELERWALENPRQVAWLRSFDHAAALARPAITVSLFFSGFFVLDGMAHQAAVQAASQAASHLATEAAVAGGMAGGGDAAVLAAGRGLAHTAALLFRRLQQHYAQSRVEWFYATLEREFLGGLIGELAVGAAVPQRPEFQELHAAADALAAFVR